MIIYVRCCNSYFVGAIYYTLGNIDPALRSRIEAIHLVCLFPCELLERYSFDDIMRPFIEEVKKLNEVRIIILHRIIYIYYLISLVIHICTY